MAKLNTLTEHEKVWPLSWMEETLKTSTRLAWTATGFLVIFLGFFLLYLEVMLSDVTQQEKASIESKAK